MRILLDECVPGPLRAVLESHGHEVRTAREEGVAGALNGEVHERAVGAFDLLVSTDRDFRSPLKFPATPSTGVIFVRVIPMTAERVVAAFQRFLQSHALESVRGRKVALRADDFEWIS